MTSKLFCLLLVTLAVPLLAACSTDSVSASDANLNARQRIERGRYLVTAVGCNDCHTPLKMTEHGPQPDRTRMLSGHPSSLKVARPPQLKPGSWAWIGSETNTAFAGPWGVSYAANLTPDQNSGLGIWTEDMFVRALRTGRHMGSRCRGRLSGTSAMTI
jgi:hypothetical protein